MNDAPQGGLCMMSLFVWLPGRSLSRGSLSRGCLCPRVYVQGCSLFREVSVWGVSVQRDLCPGRGLFQGVCPGRDLVSVSETSETETPLYSKERQYILLESILVSESFTRWLCHKRDAFVSSPPVSVKSSNFINYSR